LRIHGRDRAAALGLHGQMLCFDPMVLLAPMIAIRPACALLMEQPYGKSMRARGGRDVRSGRRRTVYDAGPFHSTTLDLDPGR